MGQSDNEDISLLIKKISEDIDKKCNNDLKKWGITLSQLRVLGFVKFRQERDILTSQKDIENHFEVSHPTVVGILTNLKNKGLIETYTDPQDKRIKRVRITSEESDFHEYLAESCLETSEALLSGFSIKEEEELMRLLQKMKQNLTTN